MRVVLHSLPHGNQENTKPFSAALIKMNYRKGEFIAAAGFLGGVLGLRVAVEYRRVGTGGSCGRPPRAIAGAAIALANNFLCHRLYQALADDLYGVERKLVFGELFVKRLGALA
jgi:hypothetical protein